MKKRLKYFILCIIIVVCCYLYSHVDKTHDIYNSEVDTGLYLAIALENGNSGSQLFKCQEEHLDGVSIKMSVNSVSMQGKLKYVLYDEKGKSLTSGELAIEEIKSGRINKILFEKSIENTKNNSYIISFSPVELQDGEYIGIYYLQEKSSQFIVGGKEVGGTMILGTVTHRFDVETFVVLIGFVIYFVLFFNILYKLFS